MQHENSRGQSTLGTRAGNSAGLPFPSPGDLSDPEIKEPGSPSLHRLFIVRAIGEARPNFTYIYIYDGYFSFDSKKKGFEVADLNIESE